MRLFKWLIILVSLALASGNAQIIQTGAGKKANSGATNDILLVDGASYVLQTDGTSKLCLAGGC